jgi:putative SOS response-associated peptidase YedK
MCDLYALKKGQRAIMELTRAMSDRTKNTPLLSYIFPDCAAPIVRNQPEGRQLTMARWGMPSPVFALRRQSADPGVRTVRTVASPHCRRLLGVESRAVVPFTNFSTKELLDDGSQPRIWFALDDSSPLACFAGIWTHWTSVREEKEGETTNDSFAFLTTEPNSLVAANNSKAMPVILRSKNEIDVWMDAPAPDALALQRPLPDDALVIDRGVFREEYCGTHIANTAT